LSLLGALAGGVIGTLVLASSLRLGSALGWTRIDLPFLLGSMITSSHSSAAPVGYAIQSVVGLAFSLVYYGIFAAVDLAGFAFGAALGLAHGLFTATVLVNAFLPAVHPRLGSGSTDASRAPLLALPGFLLLHYGRRTPVITVAAHVAYGCIVGAFVEIAP
jgi:hypothetical protein